MEIVLDTLIDFVRRNMQRHRPLKIVLLLLILFAGWAIAYVDWATVLRP